MKKRLLSLGLALVMLLSLLPVSVFAATDTERNGSTFVLRYRNNYYQTATQTGSSYGLSPQAAPTGGPSVAQTFHLEAVMNGSSHSTVRYGSTDYYIYNVYVEPVAGTKLYLRCTPSGLALTSTKTEAGQFVLYSTGGALLLLGHTSNYSWRALEHSGSNGMNWCTNSWNKCSDAYDLGDVNQGNLKYGYTVYYYDEDGTQLATATTGSAASGSSISADTFKNNVTNSDYEYDHAENYAGQTVTSITIGENTARNVLKLYYKEKTVTHTITIEVVNGTSEYDPATSVEVEDDEDIDIDFKPTDSTYVLDYAQVDGKYVDLEEDIDDGYTHEYDFDDVKADHTIKVVYSKDTNGDGVPDTRQATVTYQVVNGTWSGKTGTAATADIVEWFTVQEYTTASGWVTKVPAPTLGDKGIPTPQPATGYTGDPAWTKDGTSCAAPANGDTVTGNVTYKATYSTPATLSVTYLPGTTETVGNMPSAGSVNYGEDYTVSSTVPTRTGYTFTGWKLNNSTTTYQAEDTIEDVTSDITLTAQWRVRSDLSYTIKYWDKDRATSTDAPLATKVVDGQTYGSTVTVASLSKELPSSVSGKWQYSHADPATSIEIGDPSSNNVINLYYEKVYTLTYDANGGSWGTGTSTSETKDGGTHKAGSVSLTGEPDNARSAVSTEGTNVVFLGWSTSKHDTIYTIGDTAPADIVTSVTFTNADITVYAVWGYDDVGRSNDPADPNQSDGKADVFQAVVTYTVVNGTWQGYTATTIKQVYDLYEEVDGVWTKLTGAKAPVLANVPTPTPATGYTDTVTWKKDDVSCTAPANGDAVTGNVTYKATYSTLATLSVTYDDGVSDTSVTNMPTPNPDSVTYNGTYTVSSTEPTRAGYTFTGWKYNNTSTTYQKNGQITNVTSNITLTAQWTDAYTLIYSNPLATGDTKSETKHDATVTLAGDQHGLTTPTAAGHKVVFVGWTNEANKVNKILDSGDTAPALITSVNFDDDHKTQTVYAVWSYDDISSGTNGPDGSDNKPDVFQATVTYKVTDGTFVGGGTEKKVVFDLKEKKDGVWTALNPKLGDKPIPTPVAAEGYTGGAWTPTFTENTPVTGNKTYTYAFVPSSITVDPTDPDGKSDTDDAWVKKQLTVRGSGFRSETFTVTVTPVVEGSSAGNTSGDGIFEVVSTGYTGTVEMTGSDTKAFVFDEKNHITFHEAGKYLFTVKETAGSTRGMTYDTAEYTLEVNVVEGENGLELGEVKTVTVKNSYYCASSSGSSGAVAKLEKGTHFNYVMGYSDGTIRPNKEITRGEVAIIFFRLLTDESRKEFYSEHNDFTDVPEDSKSNIAISTLTNAGVIGGYADGTFRPNAKVTRGQLAAIIARFADMKGNVDKTFTDIDSHWAKDLILLAASNGWIDGYGDGTFRPNANITRAQTMKIINLALDRNVTSEEDLLDQDEMNVWVDNMDPDAWYYYHVQEASNNHAYVRKQAGSIDEKWTAKLEDIDWSVYQF